MNKGRRKKKNKKTRTERPRDSCYTVGCLVIKGYDSEFRDSRKHASTWEDS